MTSTTAETPAPKTRAPKTDRIGPMKVELAQAFAHVLMSGDSGPITALVERLAKEDPVRGKAAWEAQIEPSLSAVMTRNAPVGQYLTQLATKLDAPKSVRVANVQKVSHNRLIMYFPDAEIASLQVPGGQLGGFRRSTAIGSNGRVLTILEPITPQEYEALIAAEAAKVTQLPRAA